VLENQSMLNRLTFLALEKTGSAFMNGVLANKVSLAVVGASRRGQRGL
jgi:hypothetical protein